MATNSGCQTCRLGHIIGNQLQPQVHARVCINRHPILIIPTSAIPEHVAASVPPRFHHLDLDSDAEQLSSNLLPALALPVSPLLVERHPTPLGSVPYPPAPAATPMISTSHGVSDDGATGSTMDTVTPLATVDTCLPDTARKRCGYTLQFFAILSSAVAKCTGIVPD
jgi:hypothetical protein